MKNRRIAKRAYSLSEGEEEDEGEEDDEGSDVSYEQRSYGKGKEGAPTLGRSKRKRGRKPKTVKNESLEDNE